MSNAQHDADIADLEAVPGLAGGVELYTVEL